MIRKFKIKKEDMVVVITGKERGKKGKVSEVIYKKERVLINGVNLVKKHKKNQTENKKPNIVEEPAPLHISNVMYFCNKCDKGVRLGVKDEDGKKVRFCKKCGTTIK
jgi:large subunit ribosomal protein L24